MEPEIQQQQYTILRIKRKRNEEPLDALVVEGRSRRKKTKGGMSVFQFAETVEQTAWQDERQKEDLQSRISSLAREVITKKSLQQQQQQPTQSLPQVPVAGSSALTEVSNTPEAGRPPRKLPQIDDPSRKYMIVPSESTQTPIKTASRSRPSAPPKVHSYKELQKSSFTMYEAIPSSTSLASLAGPDPDHEIDKFLPMLNDYLRINGEESSMPTSSSGATASHDEDDYVWDVFYSRPATFRELYGSNNNIGSVTGLPDDDTYGSDDDSDYEDEDDEDSNAEDWYKNDYPDEEESTDEGGDGGSEGSDVFHEDSDYEDLVHGTSTGKWEYR
ncbi:hypothetical protein BC835DRAFT_1386570 [Cytidiella melzeri]|nr:hypothetical protein BC835DRAFT_1386570 [Cytidiella melzeri]